MGRCADRLVRDGLVRYESLPDDKRAVVVALTAGGLRFLEGLDR
jgi:DNA-binding MarR family transcriptional regulator